jgi:hypothetical protein
MDASVAANVAGVKIKPPTTPLASKTSAPAPVAPPADKPGPPLIGGASPDVPESVPIGEAFGNIQGQDRGLKRTKQEVIDRLNQVVHEKQAAGVFDHRLNRLDVAFILGFIDKGDWSVRASLKNNGWGTNISQMTKAAYDTFTGDYQNNGTIDPQGLLEALTCYAKYNQGMLRLDLSHFVELRTIRDIPVGELSGRLKEIAKDPNKFLAFCRTNLRFLREFMMQTAKTEDERKLYETMKPEILAKNDNLLKIFNEPAKYEQLKTVSIALFVYMSNHMEVNKIEPPSEKTLKDPLARKLYIDTIFSTYIVEGTMDKKATESAVGEIEKFAGNIGNLRDYLASHGYSAAKTGGNPSDIDNLLEGLTTVQLDKIFALKGPEKGPALKQMQADGTGTRGAVVSGTPDKTPPHVNVVVGENK